MNPGYLSFLIISVCLILLASGWKDVLAKGLTHSSILFFFSGWIVLSLVHVTVKGITVSMEFPFLVAAALAGLWALRKSVHLIHAGTAGLLTGFTDFLLLELNGYMPWVLFDASLLDLAIFPAAISLMSGLRAAQQFTSLSIGLAAGEMLHQFVRYSKGMPIHLGGARFQDHWWLTFGLTRFSSVVVEYGCKYSVRMAKLWLSRRKEWRK